MSARVTHLWRGRAVGAVAITAACLLLTTATAWANPAAGTNLISNGNFHLPGVGAYPEGTAPTGWAVTDLGAETDPFEATIGTYDSAGQYPPPTGGPDTIGDELFYEAGNATGIEGIGGEQTSATFGSITNTDDPQVGFSQVETHPPATTVADWAGSGLEIDFTSNTINYSLTYYDPWTPLTGTYSGTGPTNSMTSQYIGGPVLANKSWYTMAGENLANDIEAQFGLTAFTVNDVKFVELEDTTSSASPYPNMTSYFEDISLAEGGSTGTGPPPTVPEAPLAIALPISALLISGAWLGLRRRRASIV